MPNLKCNPAELKVTDMEIARIEGAPMQCSIIRLTTNQGLVGYGEIRDFANIKYAMMLKRLIIGENPCDVNRIFEKVKQFGGPARQGGGVSGIEVALVDLAGKAWGVPAYQLLGGRQRNKVRVYCDTDVSGKHTGHDMGEALKKRIDYGFTVVKMDLGIDLLTGVDGALCMFSDNLDRLRGMEQQEISFGFAEDDLIPMLDVPHPFTFWSLTEKGLDFLENYVHEVRDVIGYAVPLAIDHIGHINVESCIRLAKRLEKYNIAWMEDCVPWFYADQLRRIRMASTVPICTGEDIYLKENFRRLFEHEAVSVIHPDVLTTGGMYETKKIMSEAEENGVATVLHMAETPVGCMAAAHVATAAGKNFVAMEYHSFDIPWWDSMVKDSTGPIVEHGWIKVSDRPGLGIEELDDDVLREHAILENGKVWIDTDSWEKDWSHDRIWS